jgi:hypothetical protein
MRKVPPRHSPRGDRRTNAQSKKGSSATIAEELSKRLGTDDTVEQGSIIRRWIRQWRAGKNVSPSIAVEMDSGGRQGANLEFLAAKLGRADLAEQAFGVLRQREAAYKSAQRDRIKRERGDEALTFERKIEKQRERVLDALPFWIACDCGISTLTERGWSRVKPFRWFRRSSISLTPQRPVPPGAYLEAVRSARLALPIQHFSPDALRAYCNLLTLIAWSQTGWLKADGYRRLAKWLRHALHEAVARTGSDPVDLLCQLAQIGVALVEGCPCCLKGAQRTPFLDRLASSLCLLALYFHLRDSGIELIELEVDILQEIKAIDRATDDEDPVDDGNDCNNEDQAFIDIITGHYWEFFRQLEAGLADVVAEEEALVVGQQDPTLVPLQEVKDIEGPWNSRGASALASPSCASREFTAVGKSEE